MSLLRNLAVFVSLPLFSSFAESRVSPGDAPVALPAAAEQATVSLPNTLSASEASQGWKLLFDGTQLTGLRGVQNAAPLSTGWKIERGELMLPKTIREMDRMTGGDLVTKEIFSDFDFRFEWKGSVSVNSGIRYFVAAVGGKKISGLEYQIIDDVHNSFGLKGGLLRQTAALDGVIPRNEMARLRIADPLNNKPDPWNEGRIIVQGNHVEHWLNGIKACEFELGAELRKIALSNRGKDDRTPPPHASFGLKAKTGIVILDEGTEISFRNLKIRALPPLPAGTGAGNSPAPPGAVPVAPGEKKEKSPAGVPANPFFIEGL